jgi:hypothetical protein
LMRELFLGQLCHVPALPQIPREDPSYVHAREGSCLSSISPRSILYKQSCFNPLSIILRKVQLNCDLDRVPPRHTRAISHWWSLYQIAPNRATMTDAWRRPRRCSDCIGRSSLESNPMNRTELGIFASPLR